MGKNDDVVYSAGQVKELCEAEGWSVVDGEDGAKVTAEGLEYKLVHPVKIHLNLYRDLKNQELRYQHMVAAHDLIWPSEVETWNYWSERRFWEHCGRWKMIVYAAGASAGKSYDAAKIALLFWLANPKKRAVLVMSTTLEALQARIYSYCTRLVSEMDVGLPYKIMSGNNPRILHPESQTRDCAIQALAAKAGDSDKAISSLIGRHPPGGVMIIADEGTDLPVSILGAVPNLAAKDENFQITIIGNSCSKSDLHGSAATPAIGWAEINPLEVNAWETATPDGLCLYFNPYESPAISEPDPVKKKRLAKFLITAEEIEKKKEAYGENSDTFWRFVLGLWKDDVTEDKIITEAFLREFSVNARAEWSGMHPLRYCAGLDPAFSTGGDKCLLRLGLLGHDVSGRVLLDFQKEKLKFKIEINKRSRDSAEIQIAKQVTEILSHYQVALADLVVDATGQGRALAEVIRLQAGELMTPVKIYYCRQGNMTKDSFDVVIKTPLELYLAVRDFILSDQLRGIDEAAVQQLTARLIERKGSKQNLEPKLKYKQRMAAVNPAWAHSPDEADVISLCVQSAMMRFGFYVGQTKGMQISADPAVNKMNEFLQQRAVVSVGDIYNSDFSSSMESIVDAVKDPLSF